jgi:hypothetical protein
MRIKMTATTTTMRTMSVLALSTLVSGKNVMFGIVDDDDVFASLFLF